jgi:hypothetical protein
LTTRNKAQLALLGAIAVALTACVSVRVERDGGRADAYFDKAHREIARLEQNDPRREHHPHRLCVLIHDADEGKIIRISVPLWLVNLGMDLAMKDDAGGHDFDARKRYDFDWKAVKDLDRFGQGLLVALDEEHDRVLVWLR